MISIALTSFKSLPSVLLLVVVGMGCRAHLASRVAGASGSATGEEFSGTLMPSAADTSASSCEVGIYIEFGSSELKAKQLLRDERKCRESGSSFTIDPKVTQYEVENVWRRDDGVRTYVFYSPARLGDQSASGLDSRFDLHDYRTSKTGGPQGSRMSIVADGKFFYSIALADTNPKMLVTSSPVSSTEVRSSLNAEESKEMLSIFIAAGVEDSLPSLSEQKYRRNISCSRNLTPQQNSECILSSPSNQTILSAELATRLVALLDSVGARVSSGANSVSRWKATDMTCQSSDANHAPNCTYLK